ncbi:uncharacterized protein LOC133316746 isoform X2 [Gastrolobium bilobum]|uniref:uncharacterized protein LOC133316746 isoform X2 n=1 Tax=Gastrolobium bilobum TaxID=150636 RepID=UPI002AAFB7DE|nr:uncharacterized protein LOC133316746 isoform X2 [Gastrolobium bilobum]
MPSEPIPWDRKDFFKERKHERSESLGSVARWRDTPAHHGSRELNRWGSAENRRSSGHGKLGGWHLFPEDSGNGHGLSRSCDKMLEENNCRPSVSRGDGKYGRNNRENRGSFSQRDWRGHSSETANSSLNLSRRQLDANNDQRSVDDILTYSSHPHSDFVNSWEQHHLKDQHEKMGGANGLGTGQRSDRESLGSIAWKPLKWNRSGSLSSLGSGFSHSSRSARGADSCEGKVELKDKNATAVESNSGEASAYETSSAPLAKLGKKPRLNWGEGLAKYEKKKVEGPDVSANKDGAVFSTINNFPSPILVDKSPKDTGFSDSASPATPSSVACSSLQGVDDKLFGKASNVDNDASNLSGSPRPVSQNHMQRFPFNLEKVDIDSLTSLGSSLFELLQSDDLSSVDYSLVISPAMNKLLAWKADISKVLEVTETEIDLLENELKSLKSESGDRFPYSAAVGSLLVYFNEKSCDEHVGGSVKVARPESLQIVSSDDPNVEMLHSTNLHDIHDNGKEDDIDSPGTATSKFVEPLPLINAVSSCDVGRYNTCSGALDGIQSTAMKCLLPCAYRQVATVSACGDGNTSMEVKDGVGGNSGASFCSSTEDILCAKIISANKEYAKSASEVFTKLLPKECDKMANIGASCSSCSHDSAFIVEKFAKKKLFARFKERVITLKFKALHYLWKEDMRLLSIRKCRPKSHKKLEIGLRTISCVRQKNRSSIRSRFPFSEGNQLSLVPTSEMINYTRQLLSESQDKVHRNCLKMPALILDQKEKMISKFISSNGLVEDPLAIERERAMINPWTSEERDIFMEKFAAFGKDFRRIASFLDHKTTADCVEFYYKNHKSDCFEKIKVQDGGVKLGKLFTAKTDLMASGKKWNYQVNAASLEILSAASVMADGIAGNQNMHSGSSLLRGYGCLKTSRDEDSITKRSSGFDILQEERETVAADVLAGICGSLSSKAMSSCRTSSFHNTNRKRLKLRPLCKQPMTPDVTQNIDDETCSDEGCGEMDPSNWTDEEKATFLQAVSSFGKDFAMIAQSVGTRSQDQCKAFFSKARKCLGLDLMHPRPENVGSPVNNDTSGGRSDTEDACIVEIGSVIGTDKSGTKTDEELPSPGMNTYCDESNPVEARNLSADLNESKEIYGEEVDREVVNMVSDACVIKCESKLGSDDSGVVLYSSDKSGFVGDQGAIIMSDNLQAGKDKPNEVGGAVTELLSASELIEPCHSNPVAEVFTGGSGNKLEGSTPCVDGRDDKHEADTDVGVELKNSVHDSRLSFGAKNQLQLSHKSYFLGSSVDDPHATANSMLQNTAGASVQCVKKTILDRVSSTCDFPGSRDKNSHNSISDGGYQLLKHGNLLDHVEAARILQCYPFQVPVKKEVNGDMSCSNSATVFPILSQKIEQADGNYKTQLRCSSDSEKTSRNGDVKLFGKILSNPSSTQKPNLTAKRNEENGTHHLKLSRNSSNMKFAGHYNADKKSAILKFDHNDYRGLENVPLSYGYRDGNRIPTSFSSLPDSALFLAKYPAAFSNYPTSSAKLEQHSLQALAKNNEQHLNGVSAFTTREVNGSNGVIDYQMFRNRDGLKVQPFMVDVKHRQDMFSEIQRRNFEAISSLQGMVGMNGVGRPGIVVGGSRSGVSDPVAAIKMHYSNSDQCGSQNGSIMREDESWGGKGDLGR